jgi:hypothetical protein
VLRHVGLHGRCRRFGHMYEVVALSRVAFQRGDDNLGAEGTGRI